MIPKLFCLLSVVSMLIQDQEASIVSVVETISEITVTSGEEVLLKCGYERKPYAVYWRFMSNSSSSDLLVVLDQHYQFGERSGVGYDEGRYNITNDYSLIIHDVSVEDEGRYICEVSDFETGQMFRNYTNVTVTVQAIRPFVRVNECGSNFPVAVNVTGDPKASCIIKTIPDQRHVQLDCFVEGAKPQVDMSWVDNNTPQGSLKCTSLIITEGKREGTVDQKLTVILEVSEFQSEREYLFTCIAEGQAVGGMASVTVGINKVPHGVSSSALVAAAFSALVVLMMVVVVLISVLLWKKYKRPQHRKDDDIQMDSGSSTPLRAEEKVPDRRPLLLTKRTEIRNYSPNRPTTTNKGIDLINLGVFGLPKAGKSSLINSLIFSLTGAYPGSADIRATAHKEGDNDPPIEEIVLTDHIHLLNYKGIEKYNSTKIKEIFSQIKGHSIKIHCPIFICDSRNNKEQREKFMRLLSNDVCRYFGKGIVLVIPDKGDLDDDDDNIKTKMANTIGIPKDRVCILDNYTLESHEEDVERSIEFLEFILHCLKVVEENQQSPHSRKGDEWCTIL